MHTLGVIFKLNMNNNLLQIKIKERLNKLASMDYDNIECWQIVEAFNKAQIEWVRRQVHGNNMRKEGDESSKMLIDDLQILLTEKALTGTQKEYFFETESLPSDYLYFKKMSAKSKTECCPSRPISCYLAEVADTSNLLIDPFKSPSAEWGETFITMIGNKSRIYHNNQFEVIDPKLTYYRKPRAVKFEGCIDPATGLATTNAESEFKDDIVELIIDETVAILAGDMELFNQYQRGKTNAQNNN